jgi:excisionase family DNA binding protein
MYTAAQLAELLQVTVSTIWRMVKAGQLPEPIRYNARLARWPKEVVEQWLQGYGR